MEFGTSSLNAEVARHQIAERLARAAAPKIPATAHRHQLAQRLRRLAERIDN